MYRNKRKAQFSEILNSPAYWHSQATKFFSHTQIKVILQLCGKQIESYQSRNEFPRQESHT